MKIVVVGGTGAIGQAVVSELMARHEIIIVGHNRGELQVDITDAASIQAMFKKIGAFDALVSATGQVHFASLAEMTTDKYQIGLKSKLLGQINLVLLGLPFIKDHGSFTLTSGILSHDPIRLGTGAAMVNGALDAYVKAAAIEMPRGVRINCVSPTFITEAMPAYQTFCYGFESVKASRAALAYSKSVEGAQTGMVYKVGY